MTRILHFVVIVCTAWLLVPGAELIAYAKANPGNHAQIIQAAGIKAE